MAYVHHCSTVEDLRDHQQASQAEIIGLFMTPDAYDHNTDVEFFSCLFKILEFINVDVKNV